MIILLYLFGAVYLLFQLALTGAWVRVRNRKNLGRQRPSFSIVIAARNEAENLRRYLPSWLGQDYPEFELIIVLDRCTDDSAAFLASQKDARLRYLVIEKVPEDWAPKKWALQQAIAAARYDWLALTDADCECSSQWLSQIARHLGPETELVLGLGPYRTYPGGLNLLQSYETAYAALQYIGFAGLGLPYMGVGRNLAYSQNFVRASQGFQPFRGRLSGDDDLLVNAYAQASQTALMLDPASWNYSEPKRQWGSWLRQKFRHLSASPAYSTRSRFWLGLFHLSHLGFWLSALGLIILAPANLLVWIGFFSRVCLSWILWLFVRPRLQGSRMLMLYPVLDFLFFLYNLIVVPIGMIIKPSWTKKPKSQKIPKKTGS